MSAIVQAPFSKKQVANLRRWQRCGWFHPFTCGNRDSHLDKEGVLKPTTDGWICPSCDYTQAWAHPFMLSFDREAHKRNEPLYARRSSCKLRWWQSRKLPPHLYPYMCVACGATVTKRRHDCGAY